jgi:hypothetical protein
VNALSTTTAITSHAPDPTEVGLGVSVAYTVTANAPTVNLPSGYVTVSDGTTSCVATVAAGSCTLAPISNGGKTLYADYYGDIVFGSSSSAGVPYVVNPMTTIPAITVVNPNGQSNNTNTATSVYSQPVTITATVSAARDSIYPPGTVIVSVGGKYCQIVLADLTGGIGGGSCVINSISGFPNVGAGKIVAASYTSSSANFASSSGGGAGNGYLTVTAIQSPGAPTISGITPGKGSATVTLGPPSETGGVAIVSYTAKCASSGQPDRLVTGSGPTLIVRNMKGGVIYFCTATASNGTLTGPATAALSVTPMPGGNNLTPILMLLLD